MTRALEKIAGRRDRAAGAVEIVCHRCGTCCVLSPDARVDETVCVGCVRRLADPPHRDGGVPRAVRGVADWADKSMVHGPGYGVVACPYCGDACVVEVGATARTGCGACLRPLGVVPLVRADVAAPPSSSDFAQDDDPLPRYELRWPLVAEAGR